MTVMMTGKIRKNNNKIHKVFKKNKGEEIVCK